MTDPTALVRLGSSDVMVTRMGIGTAPLAGMYQEVAESEAHAVVSQAWSSGLRLFDSAPHYGAGLAEERLGKAAVRIAREDIVLSTKVGRVLRPGVEPAYHDFFKNAPPYHPVFDFTERGILESFEASCERLGVDRIDIVHLHDPDNHWDQASQVAHPTLLRLREQGRIGAIGAGMNQTSMLIRFGITLAFDCFLVAGRYTLLDHSAGLELLPLCQRKGISVFVGGVFNSGLLAGPQPGATYDYAPAPRAMVERAGRLADVCARYDTPLAAAAAQFPLGHPAVTSVVVGVRSVAELAMDLDLLRRPIPSQLWSDLRDEGLLDPHVPVPTVS